MLTQRYPRSSTYMYAKNNEVYFSTWKPKKLKKKQKQNKKQTKNLKLEVHISDVFIRMSDVSN